jgi:hypothetical protein
LKIPRNRAEKFIAVSMKIPWHREKHFAAMTTGSLPEIGKGKKIDSV